MRTKISFFILLFSLLKIEGSDIWWNKKWDRRLKLTFYSTENIKDFPVIIKGSQIKEILKEEKIYVSTIRIVGKEGEIPSQVDEYDNLILPPFSPNRILDDNDEIIFFANFSYGKTEYYLYWNTSPLPPPDYKSNLFIGDPMDSDILLHDIQLWNDSLLLGVKGPSRGIDPTKNQIENWGMGSLILFYFNREPIINIHNAWTWYFPSNSIGSRPSEYGKNWSLPKILFKGPVRISSIVFLKNYMDMDVYNKIYLFEKGNWVCFQQIIYPKIIPFKFSNIYTLTFNYGEKDNIFYSKGGKILNFKSDKENFEIGKTGKIIFQEKDIDGWISVISKDGLSYAFFLPLFDEQLDIKTNYSFFMRNYVNFNFDVKSNVSKGNSPICIDFWFKGLKNDIKPDELLNIFLNLKSINLEIKNMERLR